MFTRNRSKKPETESLIATSSAISQHVIREIKDCIDHNNLDGLEETLPQNPDITTIMIDNINIMQYAANSYYNHPQHYDVTKRLLTHGNFEQNLDCITPDIRKMELECKIREEQVTPPRTRTHSPKITGNMKGQNLAGDLSH